MKEDDSEPEVTADAERSQKGKILDDVTLLVLKTDSAAISHGRPVASKSCCRDSRRSATLPA